MGIPDNSVVAAAFGRALRQLRNDKEISQEALAGEAGMDRTYVSLMERGRRQPTLSTMIALAAALGIDPTDLMTLALDQLKRRRTSSGRAASGRE